MRAWNLYHCYHRTWSISVGFSRYSELSDEEDAMYPIWIVIQLSHSKLLIHSAWMYEWMNEWEKEPEYLYTLLYHLVSGGKPVLIKHWQGTQSNAIRNLKCVNTFNTMNYILVAEKPSKTNPSVAFFMSSWTKRNGRYELHVESTARFRLASSFN